MPITYESAAPVAAFGSVYAEAARIAAQQRNAQLAAAAMQGGGYGGSHGGTYDTGMQDAINHRDDLQFAMARSAADSAVSQRDVFAAGAAREQQAQHFQLEAQLQSLQLTQQETMRLARMKNAIGDVQNDPSLSAEEKADMTIQLKTGIDPLAARQAKAKLALDQQLKEQQAEQFKFHAATEKARLDALGKSPADRTGFVPDPTHLAAIAEDIQKNVKYIPGVGPPPPEMVQQMAVQEAMRQGLGTHVLTHADGKETIISGPGSKSHDASSTGGKIGGADHPSGLSPMEYLKAREQAEAQAHKEQQLTTIGDDLGKKPVHPQSIEWKNERTRQIMQAMGLPQDMNEYNKQRTSGKTAYDPSKAAWNQGKVAAAVTPAGEGVESPKPLPVGMSDKAANEKANEYLLRNDLPEGVKIKASESIGVMRRLYAKVGGDLSKLTDAEKKEMQAANDYLKTVPQRPQEQPQGQQPPQNGPPGWQPVVGGTRIEGGGVAPTPAEAIGNVFRSARDQITNLPAAIQGASPFRRRRAGER